MHHIVFLVGSYAPDFHTIGWCCFNIVEEMMEKYKITVICQKSYIEQPHIEKNKGQTIIRISHKWWEIRLKLNKKINSSIGIKSKWFKLLLNIVRAKGFIQAILSRVNVDKALTNAYISALNNIKEPIDVIVPMCFPMEAVIAGMDYKKKLPEIKLIPYLFDQFVESKALHRLSINRQLKMQRHLDLEKSIINFSDKLLIVHSQKKHFKTYFSESVRKILFVEHPLLKPIFSKDQKEQVRGIVDSCTLVFTGSLLKGYIIPNYMFSLLSLAKAQMNFTLHLYILGGNYDNTIRKYQKLMSSAIINHGYVNKETALDVITKSNILISIAEIKGIQVSSKIFEYMSSGKPIVHFYTVDGDINIKILKDYPLCLCLKQDKSLLKENVEKFVQFCQENKDKTLDFKEIEKIYYYATPKYIANQIKNVINGDSQQK